MHCNVSVRAQSSLLKHQVQTTVNQYLLATNIHEAFQSTNDDETIPDNSSGFYNTNRLQIHMRLNNKIHTYELTLFYQYFIPVTRYCDTPKQVEYFHEIQTYFRRQYHAV